MHKRLKNYNAYEEHEAVIRKLDEQAEKKILAMWTDTKGCQGVIQCADAATLTHHTRFSMHCQSLSLPLSLKKLTREHV